ncbi:MAG TPA: DUF1579 domain-containing protein [Vicinamibacteria bacterium]|nr:DUF1579 domain-containing protein [Vicinamibacteria bacterium]
MADPAVGPELDLLKKDVGEWEATITVTPGPGATPQESTGRLVGRLISGGRWLVTDFKNHTTGFEGHGIYGYNAAAKRYVGTWVDDMRSNIYVGEGHWDATSQTMTYTWSAAMPNGQAMTWKETSETVSENERVFRVLFPGPDGAEFEMMRVFYRRV